jgi:hypothetical protein
VICTSATSAIAWTQASAFLSSWRDDRNSSPPSSFVCMVQSLRLLAAQIPVSTHPWMGSLRLINVDYVIRYTKAGPVFPFPPPSGLSRHLE